MKKFLCLVVALVMPVMMFAQEKIVSRELPAFSKVELSGSMNVKFVRSSKNSFDLKLNGMTCAGVAYGDCMYLTQGATAKVVFHEIFHIFDPKRKNKDWTDLNNSKFRYWGINYPDRTQSEDKRREISQYYKSVGYKFAADFVSNYAQTNEVEDRAETFAAMLDEGEKFRLRVQKSRVLYNKMHFIISMTGRRYKLGKKFWQKTLGSWAFE